MDLPLGINIVNIIIYSLLFGILYSVLAKFLFPALGKAILERELKLTEIEHQSEKSKEYLSKSEKEFNNAGIKAEEIILEGKRQAKLEADKIISYAKDDAKQIVANARIKADQIETEAKQNGLSLTKEQVKSAVQDFIKSDNEVNMNLIQNIIEKL